MSKGIGLTIYDATNERCDTYKYRHEMCTAWMLGGDMFDSAKSCGSKIQKPHRSTLKRHSQMIDAGNHLHSREQKKFRIDEDFLNGFNDGIGDGQKAECEKNQEVNSNLYMKGMDRPVKLPSQCHDKNIPKERHESQLKHDALRQLSCKENNRADDRRHNKKLDEFFIDFPESPVNDSTGVNRNNMNSSNARNGAKYTQAHARGEADNVWTSNFLKEFQHNEHSMKGIRQTNTSHGKCNDLLRVGEARNSRSNRVDAMEKHGLIMPNEMCNFIFPPVQKHRRASSTLDRPIVNIYCKNLYINRDLLKQ